MKANTVTQSNKRNFPNNAIGAILEFSNVPETYYYNDLLFMDFQNHLELHEDAGFLEVVSATINDEATEKLGAIYLDGNVYRKDVVAKSQQEIEDYQEQQMNQMVSNAQSAQQELINQTLANQVVEQAQTLDDESALENSEIFPMWTFPFYYVLGAKCQHFNNDNELVLYKCVQAHESQENWKPKDVPALFTRVALPDQILPWVQPTGAQDAYQIGDKVTYSGQTWISTAANNVWAPGVYGWIVSQAKPIPLTKEQMAKMTKEETTKK